MFWAKASKTGQVAAVLVTTYMRRGPTKRFRAVMAALLMPGPRGTRFTNWAAARRQESSGVGVS